MGALEDLQAQIASARLRGVTSTFRESDTTKQALQRLVKVCAEIRNDPEPEIIPELLEFDISHWEDLTCTQPLPISLDDLSEALGVDMAEAEMAATKWIEEYPEIFPNTWGGEYHEKLRPEDIAALREWGEKFREAKEKRQDERG